MSRKIYRNTTLYILIFVLIINGIWYVTSPAKSEAEKDTAMEQSVKFREEIKGPNILILLKTNKLLLRNGTSTIKIIDIVSQGKPTSYYETMGGIFRSDYKEPLHFSSIGHVYMPYSIHLFGNYFIHGIPYYPDGSKVSSTYSGGCIRLADEDIQYVYNFITPMTPVIVTQENEEEFTKTASSSKTITSMNMTRLMVASISLEFLTQDSETEDWNGIITTRKILLPQLLINKDLRVGQLYAQSIGEGLYVTYMNKKAESLGLTNTHFTSVTADAVTTEEDYARFMGYIVRYKSYLTTLGISQ